MATFNQTMSPTPFGLYDDSSLFQQDADRMVTFVFRRLGEDILSVELTKHQVWANFEEATREFNGMIIEYQQRSNLASILGQPTGSINSTTGKNNINFTDKYIHQSLEFLDRQAEAYAGFVGLGGVQETFSGSITLTMGQQDYDLYSDLKNEAGVSIFSLQPTGSKGKMQVYEVFHQAPIQYVFNSNLASNFIASGMPVESYIPDTRFYVLPLFEDVLRAGMLETAQRIRRSHFSYKITGGKIRIFPMPTALMPGYNDKLWIRVGYKQQPLPSMAYTMVASGTNYQSTSPQGTFVDETVFGASNPANAPFDVINYNSLNPWARNWIAQYTLALSMEQLGWIRSKVKTFPIPGAELSLNGDDLKSAGREDKDKLMTTLREKLESLTYDKLQELEASRAENMVKQLAFVPIPPSHAIRMY